MLLIAIACGLIAAGCGDGDDGSKTNAGAPAGATGTEAGGAAVEAGKQRPENQVEQEKKTYGPQPPPVQLQTGQSSGFSVQKPTVVIARSNAELRSLQKKLKAKGVSTDVPPVDFKTRQVVALQMPRSSKGDLMQIGQVNEENGKIVVEAVVVTRGKGCKSAGATNPFALVETAQMSGTPKVELKKIANGACR